MARKNLFIVIALLVGFSIGAGLINHLKQPKTRIRAITIQGSQGSQVDSTPVAQYIQPDRSDSLKTVIKLLVKYKFDTLYIEKIVNSMSIRYYQSTTIDTTATGDTLLSITTRDTTRGSLLFHAVDWKLYPRRVTFLEPIVEVEKPIKFSLSTYLFTNISTDPAPGIALQLQTGKKGLYGIGYNAKGQVVAIFGRRLLTKY